VRLAFGASKQTDVPVGCDYILELKLPVVAASRMPTQIVAFSRAASNVNSHDDDCRRI